MGLLRGCCGDVAVCCGVVAGVFVSVVAVVVVCCVVVAWWFVSVVAVVEVCCVEVTDCGSWKTSGGSEVKNDGGLA